MGWYECDSRCRVQKISWIVVFRPCDLAVAEAFRVVVTAQVETASSGTCAVVVARWTSNSDDSVNIKRTPLSIAVTFMSVSCTIAHSALPYKSLRNRPRSDNFNSESYEMRHQFPQPRVES